MNRGMFGGKLRHSQQQQHQQLSLFRAIVWAGMITTMSLLTASHPTHQGEKEKLFFEEVTSSGVVHTSAGQNVVLECKAGGSPSPTIHWVRRGERIIQGGSMNIIDESATYENTENNQFRENLMLSQTKSRLYLDCVTGTDSGAYTCVAETPTKRISTDILLKVDHNRKTNRAHRGRHNNKHDDFKDSKTSAHQKEERACLKNSFNTETSARVYMWTVHRLELEGSDVQLFCRAGGFPAPKVTWYDRDNQPIDNKDPQYLVLDNGDLFIRSVSFAQNMGLYRCVSENGSGSDEVSTFLYPTVMKN